MNRPCLPQAVTTPRPPRKTARRLRAEVYAQQWLEHRNRSRRPQKQEARVLRGPEFIRALELAANATGDPQFIQALEAATFYGFDREFQRTALRLQGEIFGVGDDVYLAQVDFLHLVGKLEGNRRRKLSVREACEMVVAESGYPGHSFAAVVGRLRKRYMSPDRQVDPRFRDFYRPKDTASNSSGYFGRKPAQQKDQI